MSSVYEDVKRRLHEQGIKTDGKKIFIESCGATLEGESVKGYKFSEDLNWLCVPVYDDEISALAGEYVCSPQCFEVVEMLEGFVGTDGWLRSSRIALVQ